MSPRGVVWDQDSIMTAVVRDQLRLRRVVVSQAILRLLQHD